MTHFLRAGLVAAALALFGTPCVSHAYQPVGISGIDTASRISVEVGLPFQVLPPSGFCPVHIKIRNESGDAHEWEVGLHGGGSGGNQMGLQSTWHLAVGSGQTREFDLLLPRPNLESQQGYFEMVQGSISGYGVNSRFVLPTRYTGGLSSPFIGMSETLANASWSKVEAATRAASIPSYSSATGTEFAAMRGTASSSGVSLSGSAVKLADLPPDWRGLAGVAGLWLSKDDWERLSSDRRRAVRQWIGSGGHLFVASAESEIANLPLLPAHLSKKVIPIGFGGVQAVQLVNGELSPNLTAEEVRELHGAPFPTWQSDYQNTWSLREHVGWPHLHVPLIIGFVCVFGLVVGPLNLRVFAPPQRRHRLFLTIPLISTVASVVLFGFIAVGDGFGGLGGRNVLLYLPAGENQATLVQEQIAHSRLLIGRTFKLPDTVQLAFMGQERQEDKGLSFERSGDIVSGSWFRSRTVQGHVLRAIMPSRAEVIVQSESTGPDNPPVLLSSVSSVLRDVQYVDAGGKYWKIDRLETGRPTKLQASGKAEADEWLKRASADLSQHLQLTLKEVANRPGNFYALSDPMPEGPLETLSSIRWNKQTVLCFGECTKGGAR